MVHAKWSEKSDGYVEVFINGKRVHAHQGRNLEENRAPKFKFGIYRSFESRYRSRHGAMPTQIVYFDALARGKNRESVEP